MNPNLIFILVAVLGFVAVAGLGFAFAGGESSESKIAKRAHALAGPSRIAEQRGRAAGPEAAAGRRKQIVDTLKANEKQNRKSQLTVDSRLRQAGVAWTSRQFWIGSGILGAVFGLGVMLILRNPLIALGVAFAAGMGMPRWLLGAMAKRRRAKFIEEFPNAIDIIVRGIKSGLPVHDCLKVIARECSQPVGGEFQRLVDNLGMGQTVDLALERLYERMPSQELRFFAIVMAIQTKTGGNLAEALSGLSTVLRARKLMREKVKAMSSEAVASAVIIGSLPPGIMALVSFTAPKYMLPMFTDPRGHIMLMVSALWMGCGIFTMRKMINFKI